MELNQIKALLSMATVLGHYGLKPDKHDRLYISVQLYTRFSVETSMKNFTW